jgi:glucose-6-phosphate 1-epimerase
VALTLAADDAGLRMLFTVGRSLEMELEVRAGGKPLTFEEALHTYFLVGDIRKASVSGLENTEYLDKVDGFKRKTQAAEPVRIAGETDRVYIGTSSTCTIQDPVLKRSITVEKEGSLSTVVWNPWINKSKAMQDFGDEEWPGMLCVETANVGDAAVTLEAGQTHRMKATIQTTG